jgi:hypothetical protein
MRVYVKATLASWAIVGFGVFATACGSAGTSAASQTQAAQQPPTGAGHSTEKSAEQPGEVSVANAPGHSASRPEPTPVGIPFGNPVTRVIGAAGGTLKSEDGAVTLDVPPGALTRDATFGIQSITNEAHGHVGDAFRITPEGTTFTVPATITFRYTENDVRGSSAALLRVGYQDTRGYWRVPTQVRTDEKMRTVSVLTTHLSDWSLLRGMQLLPGSATVLVGQTVALRVIVCEAVDAAPEAPDSQPAPSAPAPPPADPGPKVQPTPTTPPLEDYADAAFDPAPLEPTVAPCRDTVVPADGYGGEVAVDSWSVNGIVGGNAGIGVVQAENAPGQVQRRATYRAPVRAPKANPVGVSVEVRYAMAPGERVHLNSNVTVMEPIGDCAGLESVQSLRGTMTFGYSFSGKSPQGQEYSVSQGADVNGELTRTSGSNLASYVWRGPVGETAALRASVAIDGVTQTVTGGGSSFPEGTYMTVTVRPKDCTYTAAVEAAVDSITTMKMGGITAAQKGNTVVGSARTGFRPVKGGMSGSDEFPLGSAPQDRDTDGNYSSGGFGNTLTAAFARPELGTATVTWAIGRVLEPKP